MHQDETDYIFAVATVVVLEYRLQQGGRPLQVSAPQSLSRQQSRFDSIAVAENMCGHYHHHRYREKLYI